MEAMGARGAAKGDVLGEVLGEVPGAGEELGEVFLCEAKGVGEVLGEVLGFHSERFLSLSSPRPFPPRPGAACQPAHLPTCPGHRVHEREERLAVGAASRRPHLVHVRTCVCVCTGATVELCCLQ